MVGFLFLSRFPVPKTPVVLRFSAARLISSWRQSQKLPHRTSIVGVFSIFAPLLTCSLALYLCPPCTAQGCHDTAASLADSSCTVLIGIPLGYWTWEFALLSSEDRSFKTRSCLRGSQNKTAMKLSHLIGQWPVARDRDSYVTSGSCAIKAPYKDRWHL